MGVLTALSNWGRRHFASGSPDYVPANGVRGSGARGFVTVAGLGTVVGAGTGYALGRQNLAIDKVTVTRDTFGVATGVLAKILAAEPLLPEDPW